MSSTNFTDTVTQVPAPWANDVNRVVYSVLSNPASLAEVRTTLGLNKLDSGGMFILTSGSINGTPIGASSASTGVFTALTVTGTSTLDTHVVTHAQLNDTVDALTGALGSVASQAANSVIITGGTIDGTIIGENNAAAGYFTGLSVTAVPAQDHDAVNLLALNTRWSTLPTFGTIVGQNANNVALTGGTINGVAIGATVAAAAKFTDVTLNNVVGKYATISTDAVAHTGHALYVSGTSDTETNMTLALRAGGAFAVTTPTSALRYATGRLTLNATDNGNDALQVNGTAKFTSVLVTNGVPGSAFSLVTREWTETQIDVLDASVDTRIATAITGLGTLSGQSASAVDITGGVLNGVNIGATTPGNGTFINLSTSVLTGTFGSVRLDGTGGYAGSGVVLIAADSSKPNVSVVTNLGGSFTVVNDGVPALRTFENRTVLGTGGDDGINALQVQGSAYIRDQLTFGAPLIFGSATPVLGSAAPSLANPTPHWVRVRVRTSSGIRDCVMPAWELN